MRALPGARVRRDVGGGHHPAGRSEQVELLQLLHVEERRALVRLWTSASAKRSGRSVRWGARHPAMRCAGSCCWSCTVSSRIRSPSRSAMRRRWVCRMSSSGTPGSVWRGFRCRRRRGADRGNRRHPRRHPRSRLRRSRAVGAARLGGAGRGARNAGGRAARGARPDQRPSPGESDSRGRNVREPDRS